MGLTTALACIDMSAPAGQPAAISQLQLASFFIVRGDTLRDTLGNAAKLAIIAYDGNGNPVEGFTPSFFLTDSVSPVRLSDGFLIADDTTNGSSAITARVIGQLGTSQTAVQTVYVTAAPTTLLNAGGASDTLLVVTGLDSASSIGTYALQAEVRGADSSAIPGVFVRFELASSLESKAASSPAAYLRDDANRVFLTGQSTPDTTDTGGRASRTLTVNSRFIANDSIRGGLLADTLDVLVTALYRGTPLANSPLRVRVPLIIK